MGNPSTVAGDEAPEPVAASRLQLSAKQYFEITRLEHQVMAAFLSGQVDREFVIERYRKFLKKHNQEQTVAPNLSPGLLGSLQLELLENLIDGTAWLPLTEIWLRNTPRLGRKALVARMQKALDEELARSVKGSEIFHRESELVKEFLATSSGEVDVQQLLNELKARGHKQGWEEPPAQVARWAGGLVDYCNARKQAIVAVLLELRKLGFAMSDPLLADMHAQMTQATKIHATAFLLKHYLAERPKSQIQPEAK